MNLAELEESRYETWRRTGVAGVRFVDIATSQLARDGSAAGSQDAATPRAADTIADGLEVNAILRPEPKIAIAGRPNPSGVFAFHGLPGMRDFENSDPWEEEPPNFQQRQFTFEVKDHSRPRRFLPLQFTALVPPKKRGLLRPELPDSPAFVPDDSLPLFSSVSRSVPAGFGHFFVELSFRLPMDSEAHPAKWALVQLKAIDKNGDESNKFEVWAMADEDGRTNVVLPWPNMRPGGKNTRAAAPWSFRLRAYFDLPADLNGWKPDKIPIFKKFLNQSPVHLAVDAGDGRPTTSAEEFVSLEMRTGRTEAEVLVSQTFDNDGRLPLRRLVIRPAP